MQFDDFDAIMRTYEDALDIRILPDTYVLARLNGRNFKQLINATGLSPFDVRFRDHMVATVCHLMECGFHVTYGYTQSDKISLLFANEHSRLSPPTYKFNSIIAGEASAALSLALGKIAAFDCRMVALPNPGRVRDYFLWRQEDARRTSLHEHCYWLLREEGASDAEAKNALTGRSNGYKSELLFSRGVNFDQLPSWQKRGVGVYLEDYDSDAKASALTRRLKVDLSLPARADYESLILRLAESVP